MADIVIIVAKIGDDEYYLIALTLLELHDFLLGWIITEVFVFASKFKAVFIAVITRTRIFKVILNVSPSHFTLKQKCKESEWLCTSNAES